MTTKTITKEQFEDLLKKYLVATGPNQGTGFFGKWAWHNKQRRFLKKYLKDSGIKIK